MIYIKTLLKYSKLIGIFLALELLMSFIAGLLNLIGVSGFITSIMLLIFNILLFSIYGYKAGKMTNRKGFVEGLIMGSIFVLILFILSLILFHKDLSLASLFYYLSLILITVAASIIGRNKKEDVTALDKK